MRTTALSDLTMVPFLFIGTTVVNVIVVITRYYCYYAQY